MVDISVIIPVYNASEFLNKCINSIINQTLQGIEIILINDGSTDNSLDILNEYASKDDRIIVINQENQGAAISRNNGLYIAKGKYLSFLDADDFFELNMLEKAFTKCELYNAECCVFRCASYDNHTKKTSPMQYSIRDFLLPCKEVFAADEIEKDIFKAFVGWAWDKLFLTDFIRNNNLTFQDLRTTNDLFFVYAAIIKANKITVLDEILANHRENTTSLSNTRDISCDCFYYALLALQNYLITQNLYSRYRIDFINYALHFSLWHLNTLPISSAEIIYNNLKNSWFTQFEIDKLHQTQIYRLNEFKEYEKIIALSFDNSKYIKKGKPNLVVNAIKKINFPPKLRAKLYDIRDSGIMVLFK